MRMQQRSRSDAVARSDMGAVRRIQIGPKIRIGGSVGKVAEKIKSTLNNTKIAGIPLGVGLGAASGGLGGVVNAESSRAGGDLGTAAKNFGQDVAQGAKNLPIVLGGVHSGAFGTDTVTGGTLPVAGSDNPLDPSNFPSTGSSGGGTSVIDEIGGFIKDHGGDIAGALTSYAKKYGTTALEAYNIYNSAKRQEQADKYATGALDDTQKAFDAKAPLRTAGQSGMLNPSANTPDLSAIRSLASKGNGNPFATALPVATKSPGYSPTGAPNAPPALPVAGPTVLGQPASSERAQAAMDAAQQVIASGSGGLQRILNAVATAAPRLPVAPSPTPMAPKLTLPVAVS